MIALDDLRRCAVSAAVGRGYENQGEGDRRYCTRQLWRTGPIRQLHAAASAVAAAMKNRIVASRIFRQGSTQQSP
jgi:hypothetical protein